MPRNILQDILPRGERRSIRNVSVSRGVKNDEASTQEVEYSSSSIEEETISWKTDSQDSNHRHWWLWLAGTISILFLVFTLGDFFSGATVTVTPKSQTLTVDGLYTAKPNAPKGDFAYIPYTITEEKEISIPADGERAVEVRASGKIVIYNNYSVSDQRLVKNTRFETPDGLIYKISNSITVPGRKVVSGKTVPGSIEVSVTAESAGKEYNIGLTDFTIPGFKSNASRFTNFYGRSRTPMTGGRIGTEKIVSDSKALEARAKLDSALLAELIADAKAHLSTDSIFYDGAYRVSYEPVSVALASNQDNVVIKEKAVFTAYFIKHSDLAQAIAWDTVADFDGSSVIIKNDDKLLFVLNKKVGDTSTSIGPIQFDLKGSANFIWQIDRSKLSADLVGKNKSELGSVVSHYPEVTRAEATIRPFWRSFFPKSAKSIKINVVAVK